MAQEHSRLLLHLSQHTLIVRTDLPAPCSHSHSSHPAGGNEQMECARYIFSSKKKLSTNPCWDIDEPWKHYVKREKPITKIPHILYDSIYMWYVLYIAKKLLKKWKQKQTSCSFTWLPLTSHRQSRGHSYLQEKLTNVDFISASQLS